MRKRGKLCFTVNPIFRRFVASMTVIIGLLVIYFELTHPGSGGERWFWIVVAAFATLLGIVELISKDKPKPPDNDDQLPLQK